MLFGVDNTLAHPGRRTPGSSRRTARPTLAALRPELREDTSERLRHPDRLRRRVREHRRHLVRRAPPRAAARDRRPDRARPTRTCSSSRTRRPPRPGSPSCWPPSRGTATTGWQDVLGRVARQRGEGHQRLDRGVLRGLLRVVGQGDRPLVVSYASSPPAEIVYAADPKPATPGHLGDDRRVLPAGGVRRGPRRDRAARRPRAPSSTG